MQNFGMTVVADENMRVPLPKGRPGDRFDVQTTAEGKFLLTPLTPGKAISHTVSSNNESRMRLAQALADCGLSVGKVPTRERTYSDRRFHRH
jgi:hypothetical protein